MLKVPRAAPLPSHCPQGVCVPVFLLNQLLQVPVVVLEPVLESWSSASAAGSPLRRSRTGWILEGAARSCRGPLPSWLAARGVCCCRDGLGLRMELQPPACGLKTGPRAPKLGWCLNALMDSVQRVCVPRDASEQGESPSGGGDGDPGGESFPFLSVHASLPLPNPSGRCSSSPGPLRCGNYCSSPGKRDLHLCCNYSRTSTAKGSKGAGEAAMGSLPSQQQAHSEDHASCKQPAQPQTCSHTLTHSHTHKHSHPPPFGVLLAIAGATAGHLALCIGSHPFLSLNLCPLQSLPAGPAAGLLSAVTRIQPSWGSSAAIWWLPDTRVSDTEIEQSSLQSHVGHQEKPWASDFALPAQPGQPPPHFHRHKIHLKRSV